MAKRRTATDNPEETPAPAPDAKTTEATVATSESVSPSTTALIETEAPLDARKGYTVLARRYRPQQFEECIGQEHVVQALRNAISTNRVAHAYLFTGARGVGKTSTARIFAKALNCVDGPTTSPCGKCDICEGIATGEDVDVLEIDGASNRGIDEVRELRQGVQYRPTRSRYKIYIIDEVHMLTKEAFNALLKTLEEPPPHAKFFFATTEPQKIPITILSRCQRFDFAGIEMTKIATRLRQICESEKVGADEEALEIIARRAGGSMRDSQSLLDQVMAFGGDHLTAEEVHQVLGTAGEQQIFALAEALLSGNAAVCLKMVEEAVSQSVHLGELVQQALEYFRDVLALGVSPEASLVYSPSRLKPVLEQQAAATSPERILEIMDLLSSCRSRMGFTTFGRTLLEMTLVRICRLDQFISLQNVLQSPPATVTQALSAAPPPAARPALPSSASGVDSKKNGSPPPVANPASAASSAGPGATANASNGSSPPRETDRAGSQGYAPPQEEPPPPKTTYGDINPANVGDFWNQLCKGLSDIVMREMLRSAELVLWQSPNIIVVVFPADRLIAKSHCEEPVRTARISELCQELAGTPIQLKWELSTNKPAARTTVVRPKSQGQLKEMAMKIPLVREAESKLGAKILVVDTVNNQPATAPKEETS